MAAGSYGEFLNYLSTHTPTSVAMVAGAYFPRGAIDFQVNEGTGRFTLKYDHESVAKVDESAVDILTGAVVTFARKPLINAFFPSCTIFSPALRSTQKNLIY